MADRTLHYWFLAPARREVLLAGKYAAGLIASAGIFGGGALLAFAAMVWPHDAVKSRPTGAPGAWRTRSGMRRRPRSAAWATGASFSRSGCTSRNPILPAAALLAREGAAGILPHVLQKISVLYHLQSLCPVPAPMEDGAPTLIRILAAPAAPASRPGAILGLVLLIALALWIAGRAVRRMEVSYGAEP